MLESIRIGDVISFVGFLVASSVFFFGMRQKIELIAQRLGFLETTVKNETEAQNRKIDSFGELLIKMGRYEERMLRYDDHMLLMRKDIDALKHGEGFINSGRLANAGNPP